MTRHLERASRYGLLLLAASVLAAVLLLRSDVLSLASRIDIAPSPQFIPTSSEDLPMTTLYTSWKSGGQTYSVTVTRRDGESAEVAAARFAEQVTAMKTLFPVDP